MKAKGMPGHYMVIPLLKSKWAVVADGRHLISGLCLPSSVLCPPSSAFFLLPSKRYL